MTANELILEIADRLNLTSEDAKARIARELNVRYKDVTSSVGLIPSRRVKKTATATIGDRNITFTDIEKLDVVYITVDNRNKTLKEITHDEMLVETLRDEPPSKFSLFSVGPNSVTITVNCTPVTQFTIKADGLRNATTLSSNDTPAFPESYHDILIHGVMADEYLKMEKPDLAEALEAKFQSRLSDLRMFLAQTAYMDIYQGKNRSSDGWWDTRRNP